MDIQSLIEICLVAFLIGGIISMTFFEKHPLIGGVIAIVIVLLFFN